MFSVRSVKYTNSVGMKQKSTMILMRGGKKTCKCCAIKRTKSYGGKSKKNGSHNKKMQKKSTFWKSENTQKKEMKKEWDDFYSINLMQP